MQKRSFVEAPRYLIAWTELKRPCCFWNIAFIWNSKPILFGSGSPFRVTQCRLAPHCFDHWEMFELTPQVEYLVAFALFCSASESCTTGPGSVYCSVCVCVCVSDLCLISLQNLDFLAFISLYLEPCSNTPTSTRPLCCRATELLLSESPLRHHIGAHTLRLTVIVIDKHLCSTQERWIHEFFLQGYVYFHFRRWVAGIDF